MGRDPFAGPFHQQIEGFVSRKAGKWSADIVVRSQTAGRIGNRHLESVAADCQELDEAVVLTVTLIIDPNASLQPEPAAAAATAPNQPKSAGAAAALASNPAESSKSASPSHSAESRPRVNASPLVDESPRSDAHAGPGVEHAAAPEAKPGSPIADDKQEASLHQPALKLPEQDAVIASRLMLAPSVAYDLLPGPTAAVALRGELRLANNWTIEAAAAFFPERKRQDGDTLVGYGLTALGIGNCYQPDRPVTLLACAGGWLGVNHVVVYEGVPDRPGDRLWAGLRADLGISATSERLVAEFRAFGMVPITRWRFLGPEKRVLFEQPLVAPGAEIAVGLRLP